MDRIGKCCDFVSNNSKYNQMITTGREDDDGFIVVETSKVKQANSKKPQHKAQVPVQYMTYNPHIKVKQNKKKNFTGYNRYNNRNFVKTKFVNAGLIHSHWTIIKDVALPQLDKKKIDYEIETIGQHGHVFKYTKKYEAIGCKKPYQLPRVDNSPVSATSTFEDPFLTYKYKQAEPKDEGKNIFIMTDNLFLALCTLQKNNFPWNIKLFKTKNKYILYSEANNPSAAFINLSTYNEN